MPTVLVRAYGRMLPRIEAEESLLAMVRGSARVKDARSAVRGWERITRPGGHAVKALPAEMPGIGMVKVTKRKATTT